MTLPAAQYLGEKVCDALAPMCERIETAGSIRRRRPEVGDVDVVLVPRTPADNMAIIERCAQSGKLVKQGEQYVVFELGVAGSPNAIQLDLWFAHRGTAAGDLFGVGDPPNFGMLLLARTGSTMHNVYLAQRARDCGLHFNPHRGILRGATQRADGAWIGGDVIASATEPEIFDALGLRFVAPERRER